MEEPPIRTSRPYAFTIVELLVTISIVGILIALLLPAIQSVRESGRRITCQNNLKQIGLAISNYESAFRQLPPGRIGCDDSGDEYTLPHCPPGLTVEERNGASGFVSILGQLEQTALAEQLNVADGGLWNRDVDDLYWYSNSDKYLGIKQHLPVYWCPSEPAEKISDVYFPVRAATGCYAFCNGSIGPEAPEVTAKYDNNGAFLYRISRSLRDIPDGLSNTYFVGEVVQPDTWESSNVWTYTLANGDCLRSTSNPLNTRPGDGIVYELRNGAFGSQHPQGALFLFGDGHVSFVNQSIDLTNYRAMSTIDGGEIANE